MDGPNPSLDCTTSKTNGSTTLAKINTISIFIKSVFQLDFSPISTFNLQPNLASSGMISSFVDLFAPLLGL